MAKTRTISPDFWTSEAVVDCQPMTRLLFIGLWSFADDFGVQPLRPRTIRMQVFPGDTIENNAMRAMVDELAAHGLVRIYEVDGVAYVAIVDWDQMQRVGKRARRRYPSEAGERPPRAMASHRNPSRPHAEEVEVVGEQPPHAMTNHRSPPEPLAEAGTLSAMENHSKARSQQWRRRIKDTLLLYWPHHAAIEAADDVMTDRWTAKWIAEGRDHGRDIFPAIRDVYVMQPDCPPLDWCEIDARLRRNAVPA